MNTPVKFELAKLLKEKGFDEWTKTWHQIGEGVVGCVEGKRDYYNRKGEVYTSAPTIAEVVMWLYEKHGIWISVWQGRNSENFGYRIQGKESFYEVNYFRLTPTESYEAAINYTLNNLI